MGGSGIAINGFETVMLPLNNLSEAKRILEEKLTEVSIAEFSEYVSSFFIDHMEQLAPQMEKLEMNMPASVKLEFYEEYNDEGGTYPCLSSISFYDANDKYVDTGELAITFEDDPTYEDNFEGYVRESIRECYSMRELDDLVGDSKVELNIVIKEQAQ